MKYYSSLMFELLFLALLFNTSYAQIETQKIHSNLQNKNQDHLRFNYDLNKTQQKISKNNQTLNSNEQKKPKHFCFEHDFQARGKSFDKQYHLRSLSNQQPHSFKIKGIVNGSPSKGTSTQWLHLFKIGSKYFQRVIKVKNIGQSNTIPKNPDCFWGSIPQPYRSSGFDQTSIDMIILLYWTNIGQYVAASITCQYYRWTIYGEISFDTNYMDARLTNQSFHAETIVLIHQITHILGFASLTYERFYGTYESTTYLSPAEVYGKHSSTGDRLYIITPTVKKFVQQYFACDDQTLGGMLEDGGGSGTVKSHWQNKVFYEEIMMGFANAPGEYMTKLTMALLQDTGFYYQIDISFTDQLRWGKGKGCNFALGKNDTQPQFCTSLNNFGCDFQYNYVGYCTKGQEMGQSTIYRYFLNQLICDWDYYKSSNYRQPQSTSGYQDSRCVNTIQVIEGYGSYAYAGCFRSSCLSNGSVAINLQNGTQIICNLGDEPIYIITYSGIQVYLICPQDPQRFCFRKKCHQDCRGNGVCIDGICYLADCSMPNCRFCNQDYIIQNNTFITWCQVCQTNYVPNFTANAATCLSCSQAMDNCTACQQGLNNTIICFTCDTGLFPTIDPQNSCDLCQNAIPGCLSCLDTQMRTTCFQCNAGKYPNLLKNICSDTCQNAINHCTSCSLNTTTRITQCSICTSPYHPSNNNSSCQSCSYFISNCSLCTEISLKIFKCQLCEVRYFLPDNNASCSLCSSSIDKCITCQNVGNDTIQCITCYLPYFPLFNRTSCKICGVVIQNCNQTKCNFNQSLGITQCLQCLPGFFLNTLNSSICLKCDSNCLTCFEVQTNCTSCQQNQLLLSSKRCLKISSPYFQICGTCYFNETSHKILCGQGCKTCQCITQNTISCIIALPGYYLNQSSNLPIRCSSGCKQCPNNTCTTCYGGYFFNSTIKLCEKCRDGCSNCSTGSNKCVNCFVKHYINNDLQCSSCLDKNCKLCGSQGLCIRCFSGYSLQQSNKECLQCPAFCSKCDSANLHVCQYCSTGFYLLNGQCQKCLQGCRACNDSSFCTNCLSGYFLNTNLTQCYLKCNPSCLQCQQANSNNCLSCLGGYQYDSINKKCNPIENCGQNNCLFCPLKMYPFGNKCLNCNVQNCLDCGNNSDCFVCDNGYYIDKNSSPKACLKCNDQCYSCINSDHCLKCAVGYTEEFQLADVRLYVNNTAKIPQATASLIAGKCSKCIHPCYTCQQSVSTCTSCVQGYTLFGWKCKIRRAIITSITLDVDYNVFISTSLFFTIRASIANILGYQYIENDNLITIVSFAPGSTVVNIQVSPSLLQQQNSSQICSKVNNISNTFREGQILTGIKILSSTFEAPHDIGVCNTSIYINPNISLILGLVLGLGIGIIVIILIICAVKKCRRNTQTANISGASRQQSLEQIDHIDPVISNQKALEAPPERSQDDYADDDSN